MEGSTLTLEERRHFLEKPLAERRCILAKQAETMHDHYQQDLEWQDLMAGNIIGYMRMHDEVSFGKESSLGIFNKQHQVSYE